MVYYISLMILIFNSDNRSLVIFCFVICMFVQVFLVAIEGLEIYVETFKVHFSSFQNILDLSQIVIFLAYGIYLLVREME